MPNRLPHTLLGSSRLTLLIGSTVVHAAAIIAHYPFKALLPDAVNRRLIHPAIFTIAENWSRINNLFMNHLPGITFNIDLPDNLRHNDNYFIIANHQTWVDVVVLQYALHRRTSFVRFFTKQELAFIPFLGQALYVMDFPYMKRYSREKLAKYPHLHGKNLETTRQSCEKIQRNPYAILNFLEGTRFTVGKHQLQQSPYRYLLKPKSGGMAFALKALGPQMHNLLDITVHYPDGAPRFIDFWSGRTKNVTVKARLRTIPREFTLGDYENDRLFRERFQLWINALWQEKDQLLTELHNIP